MEPQIRMIPNCQNSLISKNPKFSKKEQALIIGTLINKISLTVKRSNCVELKIRKFGTIHSHGNKKRMNKLKYLRHYNKTKWLKDKEKQINDINYLLW